MSDCSGYTSMAEELSTEQAIERGELATKLAEKCMAGFQPSSEEVQRALALGLDPDAIREAVDACYAEDPEEDSY